MLPTKFLFIWQSVSEKKIFRNRPIRKKNCLWQLYLLMNQDKMSSLYRGPPIDASYQVSVHLAKWFQRRRFFRNHPIRNKNCLWWPYLLTDLDEMSNHNRGLSIDASYQVSVHLAKRFQRRRI
jgi:hypothetical protein